VLAHQPQDPFATDSDLVFTAQSGADFAVALPGEGRIGEHLADPLDELVIGDPRGGPGRHPSRSPRRRRW
jgi:hypothetical protein